MAKIGQMYYNYKGKENTSLPSGITTIYENLVESDKIFTKLGVQAPPGTQFVINNNITIMIGRTGIYELDDDIEITSLYFIPPMVYNKDEEQTENTVINGNVTIENAIEELNNIKNNELSDTGKLEQYQGQIAKLQEGSAMLSQGLNGIYTASTEGDLENVIIDFIYEER